MRAQMNSEIIKWILMIILFAIAIIVVITLMQGLPETVENVVNKLSGLI